MGPEEGDHSHLILTPVYFSTGVSGDVPVSMVVSCD